MRQDHAAKLRKGDRVRLSATGELFVVTGIEPSGRIVYGRINGEGRVHTLTNKDVRPHDARKGEK